MPNNLDLTNNQISVKIVSLPMKLKAGLSENVTLSGVKDVLVNGLSVVTPEKIAEITIPTKLSEFTDDLDYTRIKVQTQEDLDAIRINDFIINIKKEN